MKNIEVWKDIPGYEGLYQASTHGRIRSLHVLVGTVTHGTGYPAVCLGADNRFAVHTLVAKTFIGPRAQGKEVNHIDGVRTNNIPENLEYVTRTENVHHAFKLGNLKRYFTDKQMDRISEWFFIDLMSNTAICRKLLPKKHTIQDLRMMRKRVRSVIEIWRCSQRPKGLRNPYEHKITDEQAGVIRKLYAAGDLRQSDLAKMYNCHPAHISRIISGQLHPRELVQIGNAASVVLDELRGVAAWLRQMRTLFSLNVYAAKNAVTSLSDLRHFADYAESSARIICRRPQQFAALPGLGVIRPEMEKSISIMDVLDRGQRKCQNRNRLSSDTTLKAGTMAIWLSRATSGRASAASCRSTQPAVRSSASLRQTRGRQHDPRTSRGDAGDPCQGVSYPQAASEMERAEEQRSNDRPQHDSDGRTLRT